MKTNIIDQHDIKESYQDPLVDNDNFDNKIKAVFFRVGNNNNVDDENKIINNPSIIEEVDCCCEKKMDQNPKDNNMETIALLRMDIDHQNSYMEEGENIFYSAEENTHKTRDKKRHTNLESKFLHTNLSMKYCCIHSI